MAGVNPELNDDEFKNEINDQARKKGVGRDIDFKEIAILSKEYTDYLTVAIELNEEDYTLLNDVNFWDPQVRIRKFLGWRWWRGEKQPQKRLTPQERKNSRRATWGGSTV